MLTNEKIYNIKKRSAQRVISMSKVEAATKSMFPTSFEFIIHVKKDYDYRFIAEQRSQIFEALKFVFFQKNKANLPIYGVPQGKLDSFATSKKDVKKGVERKPSEEYRLYDEDKYKQQAADGQQQPMENPGGQKRGSLSLNDIPAEIRDIPGVQEKLKALIQDTSRSDEDRMNALMEWVQKQDQQKYNELVKKMANSVGSGDSTTTESVDENELVDEPIEVRGPSKTLYQRKGAAGAKDVTLNDFTIRKVIGRGSFGKVFLVEKKDSGQIYAMKSLRKDVLIDYDQIENTKLEKEILLRADHPFLVGMDFVFQTEQKIFFVMRFVRGGELFMHLSRVRRFPEEQAKFYAAQIVLAIGHLHTQHIIYRDIKPENILMEEDGYICLADFGLAKMIGDGQLAQSFCGTPEYLAPEIITHEGHTFPVDWWSIGILIYEMIVGFPPFYHKNQSTMFELIRKFPIRFPDPEKHKIQMSEECKDIIKQLLEK